MSALGGDTHRCAARATAARTLHTGVQRSTERLMYTTNTELLTPNKASNYRLDIEQYEYVSSNSTSLTSQIKASRQTYPYLMATIPPTPGCTETKQTWITKTQHNIADTTRVHCQTPKLLAGRALLDSLVIESGGSNAVTYRHHRSTFHTGCCCVLHHNITS